MWTDDFEEENNPNDQSIQPRDSVFPTMYNQWSGDGPTFPYSNGNAFDADSDDEFDANAPTTTDPNTAPPPVNAPQGEEEFTNEDDAMFAASRAQPRDGGYETRVQQFLYENPGVAISIPEAGKNIEGNGKYIVYTIRLGDIECRRRYSEFLSLRKTLVNLHPTLIVPPVPDKHSMADYMIKMTKAKDDAHIIDLRKRMLAVFLNRCCRMKDVREDGVWWKFLDPNASWTEVMNSPPVSLIPKNILQAPPLDVAHPTRAHSFLPTPPVATKLRPSSAHTIERPPATRFPPNPDGLSEAELDPYFTSFEHASRSLEELLQGPLEKTNQKLLTRYASLAEDLTELGARYNALSLPESSPSLARAIEKIGQAVDSTCFNTNQLGDILNLSYAEPMRENAQFAGIVRNVLRYRILKRMQQEMTRDELAKKQFQLRSLEQSEEEAQKIEKVLNGLSASALSPHLRSDVSSQAGSTLDDDINSIDSDFPSSVSVEPNAAQSSQAAASTHPAGQSGPNPAPMSLVRNFRLGGSVRSRFGRWNHAFRGIVDSDPERNRRDQITKTKEAISQLELALGVAGTDVKQASAGVLKDLQRFQVEKEEDLKRYMIAFARCQIEWAKRNRDAWEDARTVVSQIEVPAITLTDG